MSLTFQGVGIKTSLGGTRLSTVTSTSKYFNTDSVDFAGRGIRKRKANSKKPLLDREEVNHIVRTDVVHDQIKDHPPQSSVVQENSQQTPLLTSSIFPCAPQCYGDEFYDVPCQDLARALLGKILVRRLDNGLVLKGRIVETECYLGGVDQASHSCGGKVTDRTAPMFMKPGTAYVYLTYGMYHCFNISSQGEGAAVLLRALEPLQGLNFMSQQRLRGVKKNVPNPPAKKKSLKVQELCNGPSKLCIAMCITKDNCNKQDMTLWPGLVVEPDVTDPNGGGVPHNRVVVTKRVGIESAGPEWANKPLRFYILGSAFVSKRDKQMEKDLES